MQSSFIGADRLAECLTRNGTVLLDSPRRDADTGVTGALLFADPERVISTDQVGDVEQALEDVDGALKSGKYVAGFLAYEAGAAFEPGRSDVAVYPGLPLVWFGVYDAPRSVASDLLGSVLPEGPAIPLQLGDFAFSPAAYVERIDAIKAHIEAGDVYQINLTGAFHFETTADPLDVYRALRARQAVAYGALVRTGEVDVLSFSPELFFRIDADDAGRVITARPMKGTTPRGADHAADNRLADKLLGDAKGRAENLMIVDLLRNDLARVSKRGSVQVPSMFDAERYETVTQMTSTVRARLADEARLVDILRAVFPCGSVTGAPKLRATQIIRELELGPRGVYCGAIGYAGPDGCATFNVAIRTAMMRNGVGRFDVGGGIVWDSVASDELAECMLKAKVITDLAREGNADTS